MKRFLCVLTIFIIIIIIGLHSNGVAFLGFNKTREFLDNNNYSEIEGEEIYVVKIISNGIIKNNSTQYLIKIEDRKFYLYLKKNLNDLEYGDCLKVRGKFEEPNSQRNYKGFDYALYLKTKKIYGIIYAESATKINKKEKTSILENMVLNYNKFICKIQTRIKEKLQDNLDNQQFSVGLRTINREHIIPR